LSAYALAHP
jgi:hypothetical protein